MVNPDAQTYTWTATGPQNFTGPSGTGKNNWSIRDGDEDTSQEWIAWKPGSYTIRCVISGISSPVEFVQQVGVRTDDVAVVAWIDPAQVPIPNASTVQAGLAQVFPSGGMTAEHSIFDKVRAGLLAKRISEQGVSAATFQIGLVPLVGVDFTAFSAADRTYALHWMFRYAGNLSPPAGFSRELTIGTQSIKAVDDGVFTAFALEANNTRYKLLNRSQVKYLVDGQQNIVATSVVPVPGVGWAALGNTKDPTRLYEAPGTWFAEVFFGYPASGAFPAVGGSNNGALVKEARLVKQLNEGRPNQEALNAFINLVGHDQGMIWSSIAFFSDLAHFSDTVSTLTGNNLTRDPRPTYFSAARLNTQVYPTYWFYTNGVKSNDVQNQAVTPMPLFPNPDRAQ